MDYIVYTDEPYMRDFYHWVLRGHMEGIGIVVKKGFEWYVEGGEVKSISFKIPINPFWYELGNKPDYLSSRKIYYYRAWLTYWFEGPEITVYGEWVQFTAINPNCTGFTNFDAKRMMKKYYSYHGTIMPCNIQADPDPPICYPTEPPGAKWVVVYHDTMEEREGYDHRYDWADFKPSSIDDHCPDKPPDGKERYYYVEMKMKETEPPRRHYWGYSRGETCRYWSSTVPPPGFYFKIGENIWAGSVQLVYFTECGEGSEVTIWGSSNGEKPEYEPV